MNFLRHNIVTLFLILVVGTVTALNSYTLEMERGSYKLVDVVQFQQEIIGRARIMHDQSQRDLVAAHTANNELSEQLSEAAHHIRDCHTLLKQAGVTPPNNFPLKDCPPDCEKCPFKLPTIGPPK